MELRCVLDDNDTTLLQDLVLSLPRGGTVGGKRDCGSEESERIATDAFSQRLITGSRLRREAVPLRSEEAHYQAAKQFLRVALVLCFSFS